MKKLLLLSLVLALLLCGCVGKSAQSTQTPTSDGPTEPVKTDPAETTGATEPTTPPDTQPEKTEPAQDGSYVQRIELADQSIFSEPSYDSQFAGIVEQAGAYTIVAEATDDEGNLWGKLKSGKGWVDLTEIRSGVREKLPLTANFAGETLPESGNYVHCVHSYSDYAIAVAIRPNEKLTKFTFSILTYDGEAYEIYEPLIHLEELTPEKPLLVDLEFAGDMSLFAMTFTDSQGVPRSFYIGESGRNGTIYMAEFTME